MQYLKQATAATITMGPFCDATDGVTPETGLTPTIKVSKNGVALAARSSGTAVSHDADGYYLVPLDATDTGTIGRLKLAATAAGALLVWDDFAVLDEAVYDVLFGTVAPSTLTAAAVWAAAPAGTPLEDIAAAVWDEPQSGHATAATFGAYLDAEVSGISIGGTSAAAIADAVWDEVRSGHATSGTFGQGVALHLGQTGFAPRNLGSIADGSLTLGDLLVAAGCGGAGDQTVSGTTYSIMTPSTNTVVRAFTLNSATSPSSRT